MFAAMSFINGILAVFGLFLSFWLVRFLRKQRRLSRLSSKLPGPPSYPLIGSAHILFGTPEEVYKTLIDIFTNYPGLSKAWYGPDLFYFVSKPEYLERIMNHPGALFRGFLYKCAMDLLGDGIFLSQTAKWRDIRKCLAPSFNQKILNRFVRCFNEQSRKLVMILKKNTRWDAESTDIHKKVSNCIADIAFETLLDYGIANAQDRNLELGELLERYFEIIIKQGMTLWYQLDIIFKWTNLYKEKKIILGKINVFCSEVMERNRVKMVLDDENFEDEKVSKFQSVIQNLFCRFLRDPKYSNEDVRGEINAFLLAAMDTTTTVTSFTLVLLGMHPNVQEKVYLEIEEVLKNRNDSTIEVEDLQLLKYTERVIKESMRLFPPVFIIAREIESDVDLGDAIIPEGAYVTMGLFYVQRDAKYWPDPLKFNPDRFLPEEMSKRHPYAWVPFSGGPRNCIGNRYAMMMLKVMLATIVMNFNISSGYRSVEEVELKMSLIVKPKNGFKIFMKPRDQKIIK